MNKCIDCHTTSAEIYDEQIHNLIPSVNCEKCHGPGSEHVRLARSQSEPPAYSVGRTIGIPNQRSSFVVIATDFQRTLAKKNYVSIPTYWFASNPWAFSEADVTSSQTVSSDAQPATGLMNPCMKYLKRLIFKTASTATPPPNTRSALYPQKMTVFVATCQRWNRSKA